MVIIPVNSDIDIFKAKRSSRLMAGEAGFNASDCALVEISVSELATNIVKHAVEGTISIDSILGGLEITSEDRGMGIRDVEAALRGGKSARGLGIGLSGVKRMMDQMGIDSIEGRGTRIVVRKWIVKPPHLTAPKQEYSVPKGELMKYGVVSVPALGMEFNGDAYVVMESGKRALMAVIDGLGHGEKAYKVAHEAADCIQRYHTRDIGSIIEVCHEALRGTRGAVIGLAAVDVEEHKLTSAGVGNISMRVEGRNRARCFSAAGIVGGTLKKIVVQELPFARGDTLFMCSDGMSDRFDIEELELNGMEPREIAEAIALRFRKDRDDATIVVAREG